MSIPFPFYSVVPTRGGGGKILSPKDSVSPTPQNIYLFTCTKYVPESNSVYYMLHVIMLLKIELFWGIVKCIRFQVLDLSSSTVTTPVQNNVILPLKLSYSCYINIPPKLKFLDRTLFFIH